MSATSSTRRQPVCAPVIAALRRENGQLREAIDNRAVIEQAKGALMWRFRLSDEAAFAVLRRWSQSSNVKLHTVADTLVNVVGRGTNGETQPLEPTDWLADWLREQVGETEPVPEGCSRTIDGRR